MLAAVRKDGQSVSDAFRDSEPVEVAEQRCDVVEFTGSAYQSSSGIQHGLQPVQLFVWQSSQR